MADKMKPWDEAILEVLRKSRCAMHYAAIANQIVEEQLRPKDKIGATPAITVNAYLHSEKLKDKVMPTDNRGEYVLIEAGRTPCVNPKSYKKNENEESSDDLITAYGRFWDRKTWEDNSNGLYGVNLKNPQAQGVNFEEHSGIYILHKGYTPIYVGKATHLKSRLVDHTKDEKRNRWDNFSWFSISSIKDNEMPEKAQKKSLSHKALIMTLEALLIEVLGSERNKRSGDDFEYKEFEQVTKAIYYEKEVTKK